MSMLDQNNLLKQFLKSKMLSLDPEHNMFPTFHAFSTNATVLSDVFHTDGSCGLHYNTIRHLVIASNTDFSIKGLNILDLSEVTEVKTIVIKKQSFQSIQFLKLHGNNKLLSLFIESDCFQGNEGEFEITDCPKLALINIGLKSFVQYSSFLLKSMFFLLLLIV